MRPNSRPKCVSLALVAVASASTLPTRGQEALFEGVTQGLPAPQGGAFTPDQNVMRWGPARVAVGLSYSLQYTDNVNLTSTNPQWDLINRPELNVGFYVPVSDTSAVQFTLGMGYSIYVNATDLNRFTLAPGSELSWTIPLDDWTITLFDSMSYTSDPLSEPGLSRTGQFSAFQNSIGARVMWSPDRWVFSLATSYRSYFSTISQYDYLNSHGPNVIVRAGYKIAAKTQAGLEGSLGVNLFDDPARNDYNAYTIGPYVNWQLLEDLTITARAGYLYYDFARASVGAGSGTFGSYYGQIAVSQKLTSFLSHGLNLSREFDSGVASALSQIQQRSQIMYSVQCQLADAIVATVDGGYEKGNNGTVGIGDSYNRWLAGAGLRFLLSGHWSTGLNYQYYTRSSSIALQDYTVNTVTWSVNYAF